MNKSALFFVLFVILLSGCKSQRLFQSGNTAPEDISLLTQVLPYTLSPEDKISISVWNHDDLSIGSAFSIYNTNESFGKWIMLEEDSTLSIPYLGKKKISGMTIPEAEECIAQGLSTFIVDPIVELRVLNREVTILGEVGKPGNYSLERNGHTLVEYLGKSQGLTVFADPREVSLMRKGKTYHINLTEISEKIPLEIYLQNRDVIYVPSKKTKNVQLSSPALIPLASVITSFGVLYSVFKN